MSKNRPRTACKLVEREELQECACNALSGSPEAKCTGSVSKSEERVFKTGFKARESMSRNELIVSHERQLEKSKVQRNEESGKVREITEIIK